MSKLLLHICCAVCSAHVIEQLKKDFELTAYFYNPNIHPEEEYKKRLKVIKDYCGKKNIKFIAGKYDQEEWLTKTISLKDEPEGGKRCSICYELRIKQTAKTAKKLGFEHFGTTLTISPYKKAERINPLGKKYENKYGVTFYEADWKKQEGFKKTVEISNKEGFYRQNYCGCIYSMR